MWFYGPAFLRNDVCDRPNQPDFLRDAVFNELEVKNEHCFAQLKEPDDSLHRLFRRYSNFQNLLRTVSWLLRYKKFLCNKLFKNHASANVGFLTVEELDQARLAIMRCVQREAFFQIYALSSGRDSSNLTKSIKAKGLQQNEDLRIIQTLNPFVEDGLLRVGGCLRNSSLAKKSKYPIILPKRHPVTELAVMRCHEDQGHMGTSHVLARLSRDYWIVNGRSAVNRILRTCVNCRFWKAKPKTQQMGDLPIDRVNKTTPFKAIGTDLMGPLIIECGRSSVKRYICIFNCLASRAVHFEVVQSLETSAFIQGFTRFCNRRNIRPTDVYSDNGGNFVAADKKLREGLKNLKNKQFHHSSLTQGTTWHFNPPRCSHQGGFYEAFFRLVRKLVRSIVGEATLDEYDLLTLVTEIERILNDRPIAALPSSPDDLSAITPSMIIFGSIGDSITPDVFMRSDGYRRS